MARFFQLHTHGRLRTFRHGHYGQESAGRAILEMRSVIRRSAIMGVLSLAGLFASGSRTHADDIVTPFSLSDNLKQKFTEYKIDIGQTEKSINSILEFIHSGNLKSVSWMLAPTIISSIRGHRSSISSVASADLLNRLRKTVNIDRDIRDENQFIFQTDKLGIAAGRIWLAYPCKDDTCEESKVQLTTVNFY